MAQLTPLMKQYWDIKSEHPDKILLYRMGDFYEIFHEDAEVAAPLLGIALTSRNKKAADETKMCGVPHHSIAGPIAKLLKHGHKVAICEQVEDPKLAKGIVKRAVTRILSPGMVYDPATLDQLEPNFVASFDNKYVSFIEPSTGEAFYYAVESDLEREQCLLLLKPKELVVAPGAQLKTAIACLTRQEIAPHFLSGPKADLPESALRLLSYAEYMSGGQGLKNLKDFSRRSLKSAMKISGTVLDHLEIFTTTRGEEKGSLFSAIHRCKTAGGARLLRTWLTFPLTDEKVLEGRYDRVEAWIKKPDKLKTAREILSTMGDLERRLYRLNFSTCTPRDLLAVSQSLKAGLALESFVNARPSEEWLKGLAQKIESTIVEEPPTSAREGGFVRPGVDASVDELIELSENSQSLVSQLETKERDDTGIGSLKIRYNSVFGFYIEVTKTHSDKVPERFVRKQTLANAERFTTPELTALEAKVLSAKARLSEVELAIFQELQNEILKAAPDLLQKAREWSEQDVLSAFAWLALERKYVRPQIAKDRELNLASSRHPVIEQQVSGFTANDVILPSEGCLLLTGPNMAGKSTLMRQVALTFIMAQIGSFVPAREAKLPLLKKIFTRIGASDSLSEGLSTFMVEMKETAEILQEADSDTLVILDEVGRGTSTYDGFCLAQAILEFLLQHSKAYTLFATHYHELTRLELSFPQIQNAHMAIQETGGQIRFLHSIRKGPAQKSYGVHVARLAGLPKSVTVRAEDLLSRLEKPLLSGEQTAFDLDAATPSNNLKNVLLKIKGLSLEEIRPIDALNVLADFQEQVRSDPEL